MGSTAEFLAMKLCSLLPCLLLGASRVKGQTVCCPLLVVTNLGDLDDTYTRVRTGETNLRISAMMGVFTPGVPLIVLMMSIASSLRLLRVNHSARIQQT